MKLISGSLTESNGKETMKPDASKPKKGNGHGNTGWKNYARDER